MGYYINFKDKTKEEFLDARAIEMQTKEDVLNMCEHDKGFVPVVLIDNGGFTAAGVAFSRDELDAFTEDNDPRPRRFYVIKTSILIENEQHFPEGRMDFYIEDLS